MELTLQSNLQNWQFRGEKSVGFLSMTNPFSDLPVFDRLVSVYRNTVTEAGGIIQLILNKMSIKLFLHTPTYGINYSSDRYEVTGGRWVDITANDATYLSDLDATDIYFSNVPSINRPSLFKEYENIIMVEASNKSYAGFTVNDIIWGGINKYTLETTASTPSHSLTSSTGASGFQVSAVQGALVNYNCTIVTTATIGGGADGTIVLEIAPTNSATPGDWVEIGRFRNGQAITLALTLQSVQTIAGQLGGYVPAGYYAKLRTINNTGTPSYSYNSGQEVLI